MLNTLSCMIQSYGPIPRENPRRFLVGSVPDSARNLRGLVLFSSGIDEFLIKSCNGEVTPILAGYETRYMQDFGQFSITCESGIDRECQEILIESCNGEVTPILAGYETRFSPGYTQFSIICEPGTLSRYSGILIKSCNREFLLILTGNDRRSWKDFIRFLEDNCRISAGYMRLSAKNSCSRLSGSWWFSNRTRLASCSWSLQTSTWTCTYNRWMTTIVTGSCQDCTRIVPGDSKQNERSEHIEYRSLDLQFKNWSAYPAGSCRQTVLYRSYTSRHQRILSRFFSAEIATNEANIIENNQKSRTRKIANLLLLSSSSDHRLFSLDWISWRRSGLSTYVVIFIIHLLCFLIAGWITSSQALFNYVQMHTSSSW